MSFKSLLSEPVTSHVFGVKKYKLDTSLNCVWQYKCARSWAV